MRAPVSQANSLNIRWTAAFTGYLVDYTITALIVVFARPEEIFFTTPNLANPIHLFYLALFTLSTGIGGYVAGRVARMHNVLHGLLVSIIGILLNQIMILGGSPTPPQPFVVASVISCVLGALGGLISIHANQAT